MSTPAQLKESSIVPPIVNSDRKVSLLGDFYPTVLSQLHDQLGADFDKANRLLADVDWEQYIAGCTPDVNKAGKMLSRLPWKPASQRVFYLQRAMQKRKYFNPKEKVIRVD